MIEIPDEHQKAADFYRAFLREAKRKGWDLDSAPAEVQQSMLALHQNALSVFWARKKNKEEAARCQN